MKTGFSKRVEEEGERERDREKQRERAKKLETGECFINVSVEKKHEVRLDVGVERLNYVIHFINDCASVHLT